MREFYERYSDPRARFVMIQVQVMGANGKWDRPFNLRVSEEEFENMQASSTRQAERGQWPPSPMGYRFTSARTRSGYDSGPHWTGDPFWDYEKSQEERMWRERARQEQEAKEHDRKERAQREQSKQEYFFNFTTENHRQFFYDGEPVTEEEFNRRHKEKNQNSTSSKSEKELKDRLGELAGTIWMDTLSMKTVYLKAKRRCHPDMPEGSHELWIELEEIAHLLGLAVKKKASRPNYSNRSGG